MPRIYDSLYGYIELEQDEFELVTLPIFQRLQRIKQLGGLHTIFPSAKHSRYSHSLGVFHIISKMITKLQKQADFEGKHFLEPKEVKELKFAALLHDIGHLPLSHVGEIVFEETYAPKIDGRNVNLIDKTSSWRGLFANEYRGSSAQLSCMNVYLPKLSYITKRSTAY